MKKKLLTLFMLTAVAASLTACGGSSETESLVSTEPITETSQPTESLAETESETALETESESIPETELKTENEISFEALNISIPIPESWTVLSSSVEDNITDVQYSVGNATVRIYIDLYDKELAEMSNLLIDATLSSFQKDETYSELSQTDVTVDGKPGHATGFYYQNNFCFLTAINSGESIVTFLYIGPADTEQELAEYSQTVDNTKFLTSDSATQSESNEDLLTVPAFSSGKNTSAMVDEIALTAKANADALTDEQATQIIESIKSAEHNFYNSSEDMEKYMWYGYLLDYKYDDSDPRSELGTDLYQSIKYVYRNAEAVEDSSTQENLLQIDQDLEAVYAQFGIGTENAPAEEANAQTEMQTEGETQTEYVEMVWIPNSGTKYHNDSSCSNMNSPREVPREEAEQMGYTPCKKCY